MDLNSRVTLGDYFNCCSCCCCSLSWHRSLKRKFDQMNNSLVHSASGYIEIENECIALREALSSQQQTMEELYDEVEAERNAAASAANEAMSMISRLEREKAEIQMEARQFKQIADEKIAHGQEELLALEDLSYKREQVIQSLVCQVQAYKHRLLSFGCTEAEAEAEAEGMSLGIDPHSQSMDENHEIEYDNPSFECPPLKCNSIEIQYAVPSFNAKYAFDETANIQEQFQGLQHSVYRLERTPSDQKAGEYFTTKNFLEKAAAVDQSSRQHRHIRRSSTEGTRSFLGMVNQTGQDCAAETPKVFCASGVKKIDEHSILKVDNASDVAEDTSDRIYTVDSAEGVTCNSGTKINMGMCGDYVIAPRQSFVEVVMEEPDIKKLHMRLQVLEADRESMRHEIIAMQTDKAQLMLMKEIYQLLCKKMSSEKSVSVKKPSLHRNLALIPVLKWVTSIDCWRRRVQQRKFSILLAVAGFLLFLQRRRHALL